MSRRRRVRIVPQLAVDGRLAAGDGIIVDPLLSRLWFDGATEAVAGSSRHAALGIRVVRRSFPVLVAALEWRAAGRQIRLHVHADNYDYRPPRGWWIDEDGAPLRAGQVPTGGGFQPPPNPYGEDRSWLCFPGWREYHDHHSHQDNPWQALKRRGEYSISGLLVQLQHDLNKREVKVP